MPVIPITSKTFAEVINLRDKLNNRHPFIVENGARVSIFPIAILRVNRNMQFWKTVFGCCAMCPDEPNGNNFWLRELQILRASLKPLSQSMPLPALQAWPQLLAST